MTTPGTPADPVDLRDVSDCARAGRVLFIWDGYLVIGRYTGHSLDHRGLLTVDATHPVTGQAEHKRLWRADVVPIPPDTPTRVVAAPAAALDAELIAELLGPDWDEAALDAYRQTRPAQIRHLPIPADVWELATMSAYLAGRKRARELFGRDDR